MLSREFQREFLERLAKIYPARSASIYSTKVDHLVAANIAYLIEHGLVSAPMREFQDTSIRIERPVITAKGLDFLAEDGGLSAILGVVTIRMDPGMIRALIEERLADEVPDQTARQHIIAALRKAPADTMSSVIQQLATAGLSSAQSLLPLLQKALGL